MRLCPGHLSYSCCSPSPELTIPSSDIPGNEMAQTSMGLQPQEEQQKWRAAKSDMNFSRTNDVWDGWWGRCRILCVLKAPSAIKIIINCVSALKCLSTFKNFTFCHIVPLLYIPVIQKMTAKMLPCVFELNCAASPTVMNLPTRSLTHSENTEMKH